MSQQINLFSPALLPEKEWVTGRNLAMAVAALLVLLLIAAALIQYRVASATARAQAGEQSVTQLKAKLQEVSQQLAATKIPVEKDAELSRLQRAVTEREQVLALLEKGSPKEGQGFADYFRGLARQSLPGLWLTSFSLGAAGDGLEIRGRMTDQSLLPEYIRRLNREPVFVGREFSALDVRLPEAPDASQNGAAKVSEPVAKPSQNYVNFVLKPLRSSSAGERDATERKGSGQ